MSALVDLYNRSQKPRPKTAKQIPQQAVNFIDRENQFQTEIKNFPELKKTEYTGLAQHYYDQERTQMVIPESFQPIEEGISLNRYAPDAKYYTPGQEPNN